MGKELGRTSCTSNWIIMPDCGLSRDTPETLRHRGNADGISAVAQGAALSRQARGRQGSGGQASGLRTSSGVRTGFRPPPEAGGLPPGCIPHTLELGLGCAASILGHPRLTVLIQSALQRPQQCLAPRKPSLSVSVVKGLRRKDVTPSTFSCFW